MRFILKAVGAGIVLMGMAAIVVVAAPIVRGQSIVTGQGSGPYVQLRSQLIGGPQIGVTVRDVDDADVSRESLPGLAGVVVEEVRSDSPAAEAGIKAGDVIVRFDGERVRSASHFARLVQDTPEGRQVAVVVRRAGDEVVLEVAPEVRPGLRAFNFESLGDLSESLRVLPDTLDLEDFEGLRHFEFAGPEGLTLRSPDRNVYSIFINSRARLGVSVQDVEGQLAEYFGVSGGGVLITSVTEDTPAQAAGLRAGDVITEIDGRSVEDLGELRRRLADATGETTITVVRDRQPMTVTAEFEEREPRTVRRIVR
jgi:serine protease Do